MLDFFSQKQKILFILWCNISLRSFELMIIHIQSPSITALQTDTIYVWLYGLYYNGYIFCKQRPMYSILQ